MNSIGALFTIVLCVSVAVLRRELAALAIVAAALFITQAQAINLGGFNLWAVRLIEIVAFGRVVSRGEFTRIRFMPVDRLLMVFCAIYVSVNILRTGSVDGYTVGTALDAWLVYFSFRALIRRPDDLTQFLKGTAFLLVPFALLMIVEGVKGYNLFSVMGGVPETPVLREGHYRCQGSFMISITAGSVGATFLPLYVGCMFQKRTRLWAAIGIASCFAIVLTSRSSGPLMATIAAVTGWGCWFLRRRMQWVRRGIVAALVCLHLVMKQPVWFIFDRISGITGGDGWHRANLIDQFLKHFGGWWLVGMNPEDTGDWAATKMPWGGIDVTNYYISNGLGGGLVSFALFFVLLTKCFGMVGAALRLVRGLPAGIRYSEAVLWGCGAAIATHAVNLTAVMYWDQSYVIWYLHLALAVGTAQHHIAAASAKARAGRSENHFATPSTQNA